MPTVSNPATLQSVIDTFGSGGSPTNLFAYRRGQAYVPNVAAYNVVSTTQPALSTFAGLVYPATPSLPDYGGTGEIVLEQTVIVPGPRPVGSGVQISLNADGSGEYAYDDPVSGLLVPALSFTWRPSGFNSSAYFAYMDAPTGSPPGTDFSSGSSARDTSLVLTTNRIWVLRVLLSPATRGIFSTPGLRIKDSDGNDLISKPVTMTVSYAP